MRMRGVLPLLNADHIPRVRKGRSNFAGLVAPREASGMVEVQVRGERDLDVIHRQARVRERMDDVAGAIDGVDVRALRVHLVPYTCIDDHRLLAADQERPHRECDPIPFVCRRAAFPQRFGDNPEHRAAVQPEVAVEKRGQLEVTEADGVHLTCCSSTRTPCALEGWMNATRESCAPGRGVSSINRTPFAFSSASAATMSSTRSAT